MQSFLRGKTNLLSRGARSPAFWRRRAPRLPRTAPLRRELYPYSRDSATGVVKFHEVELQRGQSDM